MNSASILPAPFANQVFAHKLNFIAETLTKMDISLESLLAGTKINAGDLNNNNFVISKDQIIRFYRNAVALKIPGLGLLLGEAIKISDYGLYGCTLLCCNTAQCALTFAVKYHNLVTKTVNMSLLIDKTTGDSCFRFEDLLFTPDLAEFNIELQCAIVFSLASQWLDNKSITFDVLKLTCKQPNHAELYQAYFQCPIYYQQKHNEFIISKKKLTLKTLRYNPLAMPLLLNQCDSVLESVANKNEFLITINQWVASNMHKEVSAEDLSSYLCMTPRTLRRKLSNHDTSFRAIIQEFRSNAAKKLINETQLTIEDIAYSVGFTDVSNFRAAFKKWTGVTPSSLR